MLRRRGRRNRATGKVIANAINIAHDKNERFILRKNLSYLNRHLKHYFILDRETMELLCWALGNNMEQIGEYLLDFFDYDQKSEFEKESLDCGTDPDEYAYVLLNMLKRIGNYHLIKFKRFIFSLLEQRTKNLRYSGASELWELGEKNSRPPNYVEWLP
jgi:hypothetical protein